MTLEGGFVERKTKEPHTVPYLNTHIHIHTNPEWNVNWKFNERSLSRKSVKV